MPTEQLTGIAGQIDSITKSRNIIRNKLHEIGLALPEDKLEALATKITKIIYQKGINASVKEGESFTIPAGYHDGSGVVKGVSGGGNYELQAKTVRPTKEQQTITSDKTHYGLSSVTVEPIPSEFQDVTSVTATKDDVTTGKIFVDKAGQVITGNMPNNGAVKQTLSALVVSYKIPKGYHDGLGTVSIEIEDKTVTPSKEIQTINPSAGHVISTVTVNPIPANFIETNDANATANQILEKQTAYVNGVKVTGTMPNKGAVSQKLDTKTKSYTVPEGYHNGKGTVSITTEEKSATPSRSIQSITPTDGSLLSKVSVEAIPDNLQDVSKVTANATDVLTGKDFVNTEGTVVNGTMPNIGAVKQSLDVTTKSYTVPAGYHNGLGTVSITTESKNAIPTESTQTVLPTVGSLLEKVNVAPIPSEYKNVSGVTAGAADVLLGKTIVNARGEKIEGAMPNNGPTEKPLNALTNTTVTIDPGYTSGGAVTLTKDLENALAAI